MASQGDVVMQKEETSKKMDDKVNKELKILTSALEIFQLQSEGEVQEMNTENEAFIATAKQFIDSFEHLLGTYKTLEKNIYHFQEDGWKVPNHRGPNRIYKCYHKHWRHTQ